ncbi:MAG: glycosyl hydrolase [Flavisolibacter sp.]
MPATELQPYGRTLVTDGKLELITSASHVGFSFTGREADVYVSVPDANAHNYLQYELDGIYKGRIRVNGGDQKPLKIVAASGGSHTVWLYKATEAHTGPVMIEKIAGANLRPLKKPDLPLIEFIGNSITAGAAADASETPCGTGVYHDQHNAYMAYGPRTARALGVDFVVSAISGYGIYRTWNREAPSVPDVYEKTDFQLNGTRLWNFNKQPTIVTIALGTNDISEGDHQQPREPFDSARYVNEYIKFIQLVQSKYPAAKLVLLNSPMVGGQRGQLLENCLRTIREKINGQNQNHPSVELFFFQPMQPRGCGGHPSVEDHAIMAEQLTPFLKNLLEEKSENAFQLIDKNATAETKTLFKNLQQLAKEHTLFGHQHATEYGHGWSGDENRSDVKSVTGSHPAVVGIDFSGFTVDDAAQAERNKQHVKKIAEDTYNRGGVITAAWHFLNPVSPGGFYWVDTVSKPAVKYLIPGGEAYEKYMEILNGIAYWAKNLKGADGRNVPVIFRPFHELDGDWFWWGKAHATRDEFITLWRFTVSYLRDSLGVHNFIYAFSTDNKFTTEAQYLERYPGDEYVDMVGIDNYGDMGRDGHYDLNAAIKKLGIVDAYAKKAGKLAAFTETGLESIPKADWWTKVLLKVMRAGDFHLSYVLVWRNDQTSPTHFYAPYPGQVSVPDFLKFYQDPYTLFENDLQNIYK